MSNACYLSGMPGRRLSVRLAGSTVMPTDSGAETPRIGSTVPPRPEDATFTQSILENERCPQ